MKTAHKLDPRTKLLFMVPANILLFVHASWQQETFVIIFFACIMLYQGSLKHAMSYTLFFFVALMIEWHILPYLSGFWLTVVYFFGVTSRKLMPAIMAGRIFFLTTTSSEMIVALKKVFIPQQIVIPIAVVMRFFPTIFKDWKSIRQAMKMRGIGVNWITLTLHPIQICEYLLVPFLMSAVKTSEELAAASLSRGIDNPNTHTSLQQIKIHGIDILIMLITATITIAICI